MDKITYGLEDVHALPITYNESTKTYEYGEPIEWPSARSLTLPKNGSVSKFYADNKTWTTIETNQGYTGGSIAFYSIPDKIKSDIFGEIKVNGVFVEDSSSTTKEFALTAKFKGDESDKRIILYRCKCDRHDISQKTKEESIEPQEYSIPVEVMPRENDGFVKAAARLIDAPDIYNNWNTKIYEPPIPELITFKNAMGADGKPFVFDRAVNKATGLTVTKAEDTISVSCGNGNLTYTIKNGTDEVTEGAITYAEGKNIITVEVANKEKTASATYTFEITYTAASTSEASG